MKKNFVFVFTVLLFVSCNNNKTTQPTTSAPTDVAVQDTVAQPAEEIMDSIFDIELDEAYIENYSYKGIQLFEPRAYEESDFSSELLHIMKPLVGVFHNGNKYELKACKITKNNIFENGCNGNPMIEPTLNVKGNCLFLIKGLNAASKSVIDTVSGKRVVWLNKTNTFEFNKVQYSLRSEGKLVSKSGSGSNYFENLREYKLFLTSGDKTQCIVEMKYFVDTIAEITFIGDLDGDGKPDMIISSPDHYESNRLLLLLSSYATGNELLKLVSVTADSFSC